MGGGGNGGSHITPDQPLTLKAAPAEPPKGPRKLQNSSGRKAGAAGAPPRLHIRSLAKEKGGGGGWKCSPLLRALTPGKKAAHLVLALQECWGAIEGEKPFPLCIPFVATILNSLPAHTPTGNGRRCSGLPHAPAPPCPMAGGPRPQGRTRLGHEAYAVAARSGPQLSCAPAP